MKLGDDEWWLQFRDVFEVDRKPVRDRDQRLYKLFVDAKADARAQAETIQQRKRALQHRPGDADHQHPDHGDAVPRASATSRSRLQAGQGRQRQAVRASWRRLEDIWMIEFREIGPGTMVKGANNRDIPSHGRVWIDSSTGRILRTELISRGHAAARDCRRHLQVGTGARPAGAWRDARDLHDPRATRRASTAAPPTASSASSRCRPPRNRKASKPSVTDSSRHATADAAGNLAESSRRWSRRGDTYVVSPRHDRATTRSRTFSVPASRSWVARRRRARHRDVQADSESHRPRLARQPTRRSWSIRPRRAKAPAARWASIASMKRSRQGYEAMQFNFVVSTNTAGVESMEEAGVSDRRHAAEGVPTRDARRR